RQVIEARTSNADKSRRPGLPLSPAIRAGEFVFLSSLMATDPVTGTPARGAVAGETRLILTNMGQLLEAAGSSLAKVVKINALIYSMLEYYNMNSVYREFFPVDPPARPVRRADSADAAQYGAYARIGRIRPRPHRQDDRRARRRRRLRRDEPGVARILAGRPAGPHRMRLATQQLQRRRDRVRRPRRQN